MELVYLWVEEYKNIKKQGFNFSPRFKCHYDEAINKLTIDENKDYVSIFPDNINVTAIVGENGSGKSTILEIFAQTLDYSKIQTIGNFFYLIFDNENIKVKYNIDFSKFKENIANNFNVAYLNISHFDRDKYIRNDEPLENMTYLGIYAKNNFEYNPESIYPMFDGFSPTRFNLLQVHRLIDLLRIELSKEIILRTLSIKQPHYLQVDFDDKIFKKWLEDEYTEELRDDIVTLEEILKNQIIDLASDKYTIFHHKLNKIMSYSHPFKFTFLDLNKKRIDFSSGENTVFFYIERILYLLQEIENDNTILLMIDELELYLHPNWQKKIFSIFLELFQKIKIHIIITSHSPFLLSDIPKENVIFLEEGKQVYPFEDEKQTFGANIHTLLSHGFFMKDGLMGEFAKSKINEIIEFFNNKNNIYQDNKEKLLKIINIIGEPFLKEKLLFMYNEKYPKTNEEKIAELEAEIKRLNRLKNAENRI